MAQTKPKAGQFYGVSNNGTDGEFLQTDGTGGMAWASPITNPTITSIDYPGSATAANPAGGESVIINGTLFASGITCTVGGTSAVTAFNSATQITITTPAKAAGPYTIAVANPDGGTASETNFIQYSGVPVWSTAAGTLGNVMEGEAASFQVTATEGSDTIEYAVTTGTLPTGLSLATATGAITGTAPTVSADTTTTFSITATDDENQTSASRSFSITVQNNGPSNHFNTVLYTGNNSAQSITGVGFQSDFTWIKARDNGVNNHALTDSIRGTGSGNGLSSNTTGAEGQYSAAYGYLSAFGTDGFTVQAGSTSPNFVNSSSANYVAWNFKAGGAAVANTNGTINSNVSVNNTLGFSIVSYTGNGVQGATVGHGLDAAPDLIIAKGIGNTGSWRVGVTSLGWQYYMNLDGSPGANVASSIWNSTTPTSSVFSLGNNPDANGSNQTKIAYCFTSKPGFSKVGSYTGTGAAGNAVVTGFEPAFVMMKAYSTTSDWFIVDNKRNANNPRNSNLRPNNSNAESNAASGVDFLSNGFIFTGAAFNDSSVSWIYLAIAADGSTATPSLANSFAPEIYTGNGSTQSITSVGFQPDFVWIKSRSTTLSNVLHDTLTQPGLLISNGTSALINNGSNTVDFTSNGFNLQGGASHTSVNGSGTTYVSWNWKAGGTPSINTDGTITSIVSANQAAGFSVVKYKGNNTNNATVGTGLTVACDLVIVKDLTSSNYWCVGGSTVGNGENLYLNDTGAKLTRDRVKSVQSNTFTLGNHGETNSTNNFIAYCFTSISGYSKAGSYTSDNQTTKNISVGFRPSFLLLKRTNAAQNWAIVDDKRPTYELYPNTSGTEAFELNIPTFNSDGFTLHNTRYNGGTDTYIYLAIKEN